MSHRRGAVRRRVAAARRAARGRGRCLSGVSSASSLSVSGVSNVSSVFSLQCLEYRVTLVSSI